MGFCLNPFNLEECYILNPVGLYIHIPFCVKKCNYCDFFSLKAEENLMDEYLSEIDKAFTKWSERASGRVIDTVYFGGGTPSVLGTERINKILASAFKSFNIASDCEITIEVNPNSTNMLDFNSLRINGINRVSMGLQSSDDKELKLLGRLHTSADASFTIEQILNSGIMNFSLDVMLGIPLQTFDSLNKTLDYCVDSGATHISTYMLKIEENTPFYLNKNNLNFADDDLQADFFEYTANKLKDKGFRHYEISNFCKDDCISRHNMKYWLLDDYIGVGPSAHSLIDSKRLYYPRSLEAFYEDKLLYDSEGHTPEEYLMLSLRTDKGFDFKKYNELFNLIPTEKMISEAKNLEKLGLINVTDYNLSLTEKGYLLSNSVIAHLLNTGI